MGKDTVLELTKENRCGYHPSFAPSVLNADVFSELLQSFCDNRAPNISESQEASGHIGSATIGLLNYFHNCLPPDLVL